MKMLVIALCCFTSIYLQGQCRKDPFSGTWNSDFGKLTFWYTSDNKVSGSYSYTNKKGYQVQGSLTCVQSKADCNSNGHYCCYHLSGTWRETINGGSSTGTVTFYLNADSSPGAFSGRWDADDSIDFGFWNVWKHIR